MVTMPKQRRKERSSTTKPAILSIATILLAILATAVFITSGGSAVFYSICVVAIVVALYNTITISKLKR
jgi:hypothetical protein